MAGIYFHIPFCRQACHYCDFHFSTSLSGKADMLEALHLELEARRGFFDDTETITSVYFGGGTPSLLDPEEAEALFAHVADLFPLSGDAEVTLEANPEDLDPAKLDAWRRSPVNRLSVGVQSFMDADLAYMNRSHDGATAARVVKEAADAGFTDISADLIYGTPTMDDDTWRRNLDRMFGLPVNHLSCYALTVEPGTALDTMIRKRKRLPVDEACAAAQFEILVQAAVEAGFDHYEISNFCRQERYARHNTGYWKGSPYLGIGPSAHSYDGTVRRWNVSHNSRYVKSARSGMPEFRQETLASRDRYNEYILTGLRTRWGVSLAVVRDRFGEEQAAHFQRQIAGGLADRLVRKESDNFYLTHRGMLVADRITAQLFA
jgi:oxygen-independent coproporphyrinogen-3 oxidase